jgi:hypothetical protein
MGRRYIQSLGVEARTFGLHWVQGILIHFWDLMLERRCTTGGGIIECGMKNYKNVFMRSGMKRNK